MARKRHTPGDESQSVSASVFNPQQAHSGQKRATDGERKRMKCDPQNVTNVTSSTARGKDRRKKKRRSRKPEKTAEQMIGKGKEKRKRKRKLDPSAYTVGWICALSKEVVPAVLLLDEEHESLPQQDTDNNCYYLGRMGEHNLVIATLPKGRYGGIDATRTVLDLVRTFQSIRFCLLIGIGAGVPAAAPDIRLGDVVVGIPDEDLPGVVKFDQGAELPGHEFIRRGSLNQPPRVLLTAAGKLDTQISLGRGQVPARIKHVQQQCTPSMGRFAYPGKGSDRLFLPEYSCTSRAGDGTCGACDERKLSPRRPDRLSEDPVVHFGTVASGSKVVKNPALRDRIGKEYRAKCIEMEAAGIMNNLPCLVIRGISDYADSHKNDLWQDYAAMTASACGRELLGYVSAKKVRAEESLNKTMERVDRSVRAMQSDVRNMQRSGEIFHQREIILRNLYNSKFEKRHEVYHERAGVATWSCVIDHSAFQSWCKTEDKIAVLCCLGAPGVGKSCMMSVVVNGLKKGQWRSEDNSGLAYVYCKHEDRDQTASSIIKALVAQLFCQKHKIPVEIRQILMDASTSAEIKFQAISSVFDLIYVLIDGLDEWQDRPRKSVLDIFEHLGPKLRLFITSRKRITYLLMKTIGEPLEIPLYAEKVDVEAHIRNTVIGSAMASPQVKPEFERTMTDKIIRRAAGNFLFADSLTKFVLAGDSEAERKQRLIGLPQTIEGAFRDVIERALSDAAYGRRREQIFSLLAFAERPLTIGELLHAVEIDNRLSMADFAEIENSDIRDVDLMDSANLQDRCLGLITLDESDSTVRLFHRSLHDYLRNQNPGDRKGPIFPSSVVQYRFFRICLGYLELTSVLLRSVQMARDVDDTPDMNDKSIGFISYAAIYWGHHLRKAGQSDESLTWATKYLCRDFTERYLGQWYLCNALPKHYQPQKLTGSFLLSFSNLHIAAYFGLEGIVPVLCRKGDIDINAEDSNNATPLHWAAGQGFYEIIEAIASRGADVERREVNHATPLVWLMDWVETFEKLDNDGWDSENISRLRWKTADRIASFLLKRYKSFNIFFKLSGGRQLFHQSRFVRLPPDPTSAGLSSRGYLIGEYQTPLMRAAEAGWDFATKELLERNADFRARNDRGWTALHFAAKGGNRLVAERLRNRGADPNAQDYHGLTPSDVLAVNKHVEVDDALKNALPASDSGDQLGLAFPAVRTTITETNLPPGEEIYFTWHRVAEEPDTPQPVPWAAHHGHEQMIRILLHEKKLVDGTDHHGRTALSWAAQRGNTTVLELLLEHHAEVEARDANGRTPLSWAAENGQKKVSKILLDHGASIEDADTQQLTPLVRAVIRGHAAVVKILLKYSAKPHYTDMTGRSLIAWAASAGNTETLKLFLEPEAYKTSLNAKDNYGNTPLTLAAANGQENVVQVLLDAGADPDGMDCNKQTPFLWAAKGGHVGIMRLLQIRGANTQAPDDRRRSPLAWAAGRGHTKAVKYLLRQGARPLSADSNGVTPLAWAAAGGHVKIMEILLGRGANPSSKDADGRTILSWAVQTKRTTQGRISLRTSVSVSLESGVNLPWPALVSLDGSDECLHCWARTCLRGSDCDLLSWSFGPSNIEAVRLLLQRTVELDVRDQNGRTPLSLACEKGDRLVVDLLLDHGADLDAPDHARRTPVSWAAGAGNVAAVGTLLARHADFTLADNGGRTPLSWAVAIGSLDIVYLLIRNGADASSIDDDGLLRLSRAMVSGNEAMVLAFLRHQKSPHDEDSTLWRPLSWSRSKDDLLRSDDKVSIRRGLSPNEQNALLTFH